MSRRLRRLERLESQFVVRSVASKDPITHPSERFDRRNLFNWYRFKNLTEKSLSIETNPKVREDELAVALRLVTFTHHLAYPAFETS